MRGPFREAIGWDLVFFFGGGGVLGSRVFGLWVRVSVFRSRVWVYRHICVVCRGMSGNVGVCMDNVGICKDIYMGSGLGVKAWELTPCGSCG